MKTKHYTPRKAHDALITCEMTLRSVHYFCSHLTPDEKKRVREAMELLNPVAFGLRLRHRPDGETW